MRTKQQVIKEMEEQSKLRSQYNQRNNEGATDGYNPHEDKLSILHDELLTFKSESILDTNLAGERAWFNAQGFTSLQVANKKCLERGYPLCSLKAAIKAIK